MRGLMAKQLNEKISYLQCYLIHTAYTIEPFPYYHTKGDIFILNIYDE